MTFFALHSSGVISCTLPVLYEVTSRFAFSRPAEDVKSVLRSVVSAGWYCRTLLNSHNKSAVHETKCVQSKTASQWSWTHHSLRVQCLSIAAQLSHLGSEMLAACCTRPQYVVRSYWELGRSRVPGSEEVMSTDNCSRQLQPRRLCAASYRCWKVERAVIQDGSRSQTIPISLGEVGGELRQASDPQAHTNYGSCNRVEWIPHCRYLELAAMLLSEVSWYYSFRSPHFQTMRVSTAHKCDVAKNLMT